MESDAQQVVTLETEPSLQPTLVSFSSRADADDGVTADALVRLSMTLGFISYRYLIITVGPDGYGR
jgi:hypothetical protein